MVSLEQLSKSTAPHVAYNAALELGLTNSLGLRKKMVTDDRVSALIKELRGWPGPHINSHKSANQFFHKLVFLADIGIEHTDPGIMVIIKKILASLDQDGIPCLTMNIAKAFGGSGKDIHAWALCDAPNTLYALVKMGVQNDKISNGVKLLAEKIKPNGFGCVGSKALGNWRGPGKKDDPCPYATLIMLKLLLLFDKQYQKEIKICAECLLDLWEHSREKHPYIFYMGNNFRKLKLPFIWYDILHVVDVLSRIKSFRKDPRLLEMYKIIKVKETDSGYIPESVYQPFKDWDFGQKKVASEWMTLQVLRIGKRLAKA